MIGINTAIQSMSGEFSVDRFSSKSDQDLDSIRFGFNQLSASLGDGSKDFLTLSEGSGDLLVMPEGVAFKGSGSVSLESNGVNAEGKDIELQINNLGSEINRTFGSDSIQLSKGPYVRFKGELDL